MFRIGPWTTYHEIRKDGRFPDVEGAVPDEAAVTTRLRIDPEDGRFLVTGSGQSLHAGGIIIDGFQKLEGVWIRVWETSTGREVRPYF